MIVGRQMIALGLIAAAVLCASACGDDDESDSDTGAVAAAPSPHEAFSGFSGAVEAQGMQVSVLPADQLHGAEAGRQIQGSNSGTALLFKTEDEAKDYADKVTKSGDEKTATAGAVVFVSSTQADADFFADAYEGG